MVLPRDSQNMPHFGWHKNTKNTIFFPNEEVHPVTETTMDAVVNTVKDIVTAFVETQTTPTTTSTTTQGNLEETFNSNNTMMETNANRIDEIINSTATQLNDTLITEMVGSNRTLMEFNNTMVDETTTIMPTIIESGDTTGAIATSVNTVVDAVVTTTESMFNTIAEVLTSSKTPETASEDLTDVTSENYGDTGEEKTLYIVLGVIIGALILLCIIISLIYRRYKMLNTSTRVYCVTDLNEVSVSSCKEGRN